MPAGDVSIRIFLYICKLNNHYSKMQRYLLLLPAALLAFSLTAGAQAKINNVVTSDYNRNSVSLVNIQRNDSYDNVTSSVVNSYSLGAKYDVNLLQTKNIRIRKTRKNAVDASEVEEAVQATPFAREILASIFNRDSNGMMNDKTVRYRGNYDAKDQDVINARAARVGVESLGDMGHALVKGSYVVLTDFYSFDKYVDKKGKVTWSVNARAYAYRIGISDDGLYDFYEKCWIYDDDDQATRSAKLRAFQDLAIPMEYVTSVSTTNMAKTEQEAVYECMGTLITNLENSIPEWEVAVGISAVKPVRAKIGSKEGLTNKARYRAYSYAEDDNGNLKSVARGFLRATQIADNMGMSSGETEPSEFYQVSGLVNVEEGWTIKQSNDLGLGVMLGYGTGIFGSVRINVDYLLNARTNGQMSYLLFDATMDLGHGLNLSSIYAALGFAYGFHLTRFVELAPYAMAGLDYMSPSSSYFSGSEIEDSMRILRRSGFVLEPGLRAVVNVAYPLQAYGRIYYDLLLYNRNSKISGSYAYYNAQLNHKSGVGFQFGLKWTF